MKTMSEAVFSLFFVFFSDSALRRPVSPWDVEKLAVSCGMKQRSHFCGGCFLRCFCAQQHTAVPGTKAGTKELLY